jgi:Flp pilus assembly protein TadD
MNESNLQQQKHDNPRTSTFRGISIERRNEYENAYDSIRISCEMDSNENDESDRHIENADDPRMSTFRGISIDRRNEDEKAYDSIRINRECDSNRRN